MLSKSTLIKLKTILKQSFDFGLARRYVTWNPARVALLPADAEQKRYPRALLPAEHRALINVASEHRLGAWVVVTPTLALRPGEVYDIGRSGGVPCDLPQVLLRPCQGADKGAYTPFHPDSAYQA
jgi:hypothetical protein